MDKHIMGTLCEYRVGSKSENCGTCTLSILFKMLSADIGEDVYMCELFSPMFAIYVYAKMVCDSWRDQSRGVPIKRGRKPFSKELGNNVRWYYHNTSMSMVDVAKKFNISIATVTKMVNDSIKDIKDEEDENNKRG